MQRWTYLCERSRVGLASEPKSGVQPLDIPPTRAAPQTIFGCPRPPPLSATKVVFTHTTYTLTHTLRPSFPSSFHGEHARTPPLQLWQVSLSSLITDTITPSGVRDLTAQIGTNTLVLPAAPANLRQFNEKSRTPFSLINNKPNSLPLVPLKPPNQPRNSRRINMITH